MVKLTIQRLIWTDWNIEHIARHNVTPDEVEQAVEGQVFIKDSYDERYLLTGSTDEMRVLTIVLTEREEHAYFVVTARPASRRERKQYKVFLEGLTDDE